MKLTCVAVILMLTSLQTIAQTMIATCSGATGRTMGVDGIGKSFAAGDSDDGTLTVSWKKGASKAFFFKGSDGSNPYEGTIVTKNDDQIAFVSSSSESNAATLYSIFPKARTLHLSSHAGLWGVPNSAASTMLVAKCKIEMRST